MTETEIKKYTLLVATLASFLTPFMGSAINLAIPSIGQEFHAPTLSLNWIATSYILASAAFLVPLGRLADIIGRKTIFVWGMVVYSTFSVLCGLSWSITSLIIFRIFQGIGGAMIFGTAMALLTSAFPPQERGKVIGINVASVYIGLASGPVLGGIITYQLGWPSIFFLTAFIGTIVIAVSLKKLTSEWAGGPGETFDIWGTLLYMTGLIFFMYGISSITNVSWAKYLLILGLIIFACFIRFESKTRYPILNIHLFSSTTFAFSNLAALINYSATYGSTFLLSLYLQTSLSFDAQKAGLILLTQPIIMAALSPITGSLSDRVEPRTLASLGMGISCFGLLVLSFISLHTPLWLIILNLALLGFGFALFSSPNSNAVMGAVEKRFYGIASSTLGTMRLTGQAISMSIVTMIMALHIGNAKLTPALSDQLIVSARSAFIIFTIFSFVGIFASLARGKTERTVEKK